LFLLVIITFHIIPLHITAPDEGPRRERCCALFSFLDAQATIRRCRTAAHARLLLHSAAIGDEAARALKVVRACACMRDVVGIDVQNLVQVAASGEAMLQEALLRALHAEMRLF